MSTVTTHAPGTVCWAELGTTDPGAAAGFYRALMGWEATEVPVWDDGTYTLFQQDGLDMGGAYRLMAQQQTEGVPPHWMLYTAVEDVDATAEAARAHGGAVLAEPMDLPNVGRMAVLSDPEGAVFAVMRLAEHPGTGAKNAPGALCWTELSARDPDAARAFYQALFGWDARLQEDSEGKYTMFSVGGADQCGMVQMDEAWGDAPAAWMPYFGVADLDAAMAAVREHGGTLVAEPIEAEGVGRFVVVRDPQGASLYVIQLATFG